MRLIKALAAIVLSVGVGASVLHAAKSSAGKDPAAKGPEKWEPTIRKFEADDKANPPAKGGIVLVGGSNAARWKDVGKYFPGESILNRGFGGAQLSEVVHFFDRIVVPYAPATIILNAGGNDLSAGKTAEEVRDYFKQFVERAHAALPKARVIYVCVPLTPTSFKKTGSGDGVNHYNGLIQEVIKQNPQCRYVDLFPDFVTSDGKPKAELYVEDGTHFNPTGQTIVAKLIHEQMK